MLSGPKDSSINMTDLFIFPANTLERLAYYQDSSQIKKGILRSIVVRVIACVAPILYAYQIVLSTILGPTLLPGVLFNYKKGISFFSIARDSCINMTSSIAEILPKIWDTDYNCSFWGTSDRYTYQSLDVD